MKRKKFLPLLVGILLAVSLFPAASAMGEDRPQADYGGGAAAYESSTEEEDTEDTEDTVFLYNERNGYAYLVSGLRGTVSWMKTDRTGQIPAEGTPAGERKDQDRQSGRTDVELLSQSKDSGFVYGDITASALSEDGSMLAVALCDMDSGKQGRVVLFQCRRDGSLQYLGMAASGVRPQMILFGQDGKLLLTADEGLSASEKRQLRDGKSSAAPEGFYNRGRGSVTVISVAFIRRAALSPDMPECAYGSAVIADFSAFDEENVREYLIRNGIIEAGGQLPSDIFRPETIAVSGEEAFVKLKGTDAVALLDLTEKRFTDILAGGEEL